MRGAQKGGEGLDSGESGPDAAGKLRRMASYATEREIVVRFLSAFGITDPRLSDPNAGLKKDTGADVVWTHDEGQTAFQVTEYHSDKGLGPKQKGSQLRLAEKTKAASGRPYTMWVGLD